MEFSEDQIKDAKAFCDFYMDLIHNFSDKTKYFLSDDVVLDYFGHTIKGQKNVANYIKNNIVTVRHLFENASPVAKIGFRETHVVNVPRAPKKLLAPFFSPPKTNEPKTPTKASQPSTSTGRRLEMGQGDGAHQRNEKGSPAKKMKLNHVECSSNIRKGTDFFLETEDDEPVRVKYMMAEGHVEFRKPSTKKLQTENKWKRPCKLSIAYSSTTIQDCAVYLIIYEGNVKCRRNLLRDFEETGSKD